VINVRSLLYSLCMVIELVFFMYIYIVGQHGVRALRLLRHECAAVEISCKKLEQEAHDVRESIHTWNTYPFYKEHMARQQLHMGKSDEMWYWYGV
jgi:cell division protein FtsB